MDRQGKLSVSDHLHGIIVIPYVAPDVTASNPNTNAIVGAGLVPARDVVTRVDPDPINTVAGLGTVYGTSPVDRATTRVAPTVGDVVGAFRSRIAKGCSPPSALAVIGGRE